MCLTQCDEVHWLLVHVRLHTLLLMKGLRTNKGWLMKFSYHLAFFGLSFSPFCDFFQFRTGFFQIASIC